MLQRAALRVVDGEVPARLVHGEEPGGRMRRALATEGWVLARPHGGRQPHPSGPVEHRVVHVVLARPHHLGAPIRRRLRHVRGRRLRRGVAHGERDAAGAVGRRIQNRHEVGAQLERSVHRPVRVDGRVAAVRRHHVVQVRLRVGPVPQRDDDVALDAARTRRRRRHRAGCDAVGPAREHLKRALAAEAVQRVAHLAARLSRLHAPVPRLDRGGEAPERGGDLARPLAAELVARPARPVLDHAQPLRLMRQRRRDAVPLIAGAGELALGRYLEQREPVAGRVVLCGRASVGVRGRRSGSASPPAPPQPWASPRGRSRAPTPGSARWAGRESGSAPDHR